MTWADFFSSQIFGIIVGALITTGFTWFLDWRKSVREQKFRSIEKRNEAYFAVFDVFFGLLDTDFNGVGEVYDEHIVGKYEKTRAAVFMYGSKEMKKLLPPLKLHFENKIDRESYKDEIQKIFNEIVVQIFIELGYAKKMRYKSKWKKNE